MSQQYATIVADVLRADPTISGLATGGVFDRDPRGVGPNATTTMFATDDSMDILPTIAVTPSTQSRSPYGPPTAFEGYIVVRFFVPDFSTVYDTLEEMVDRAIEVVHGYRHSNDYPAVFRWFSRLGMTRGGLFEDVAYEELRFQYVSMR